MQITTSKLGTLFTSLILMMILIFNTAQKIVEHKGKHVAINSIEQQDNKSINIRVIIDSYILQLEIFKYDHKIELN